LNVTNQTVTSTLNTATLNVSSNTYTGNLILTPGAAGGYVVQPTFKSYREYYQSGSAATTQAVDLSSGNYFDYTLTAAKPIL
jgi:hypothetical protein